MWPSAYVCGLVRSNGPHRSVTRCLALQTRPWFSFDNRNEKVVNTIITAIIARRIRIVPVIVIITVARTAIIVRIAIIEANIRFEMYCLEFLSDRARESPFHVPFSFSFDSPLLGCEGP